MSLQQYLAVMTSATLVSYLLLAAVVNFFSPTSGALPLVLFYLTLALSIMGTMSIAGFLLRHYFSPNQIVFREVIISFRQSVWFAILGVCSFILLSQNSLNLTSLLFLTCALAALEMYIISKTKSR